MWKPPIFLAIDYWPTFSRTLGSNIPRTLVSGSGGRETNLKGAMNKLVAKKFQELESGLQLGLVID